MTRIALACMVLVSCLYADGCSSRTDRQVILEAPGPAGPLRGILYSASSASASVVLIIPGSGPTDHDGTNPLGVNAGTYRLLADGLAHYGISSVRIDKRGMFMSSLAVADANAVTMDDYVADVASWVNAIRRRTGQHCVWVLGHSEGGVVAVKAAQSAANICGLVLIATPGHSLGDIFRTQLKADPDYAPILAGAMSAISELEAGRRLDTSRLDPGLQSLFYPGVQGFLISLFATDPAKLLHSYGGPVLIMQGLRDIQVDRSDAELLHAAKPSSSLVLLPKVNHLLKVVDSDERAANLATYMNPTLPLAPEVAADIARFVSAKH